MAIPIGAIVELSFRGTIFNQQVLTIRHYRSMNNQAGANVAQDLEEFNTAIAPLGPDDLVSDYLACAGPEYVLDEYRSQVVAPTRSLPVPRTVGAVGTFGTVVSTTNVCGVITFYTDKAGRSQIGSAHMPAPPVEGYGGGTVTPDYAVRLGNIGDAFLSTINVALGAGAYIPGIWHRTVPPPNNFDQLQTRTVQTTLRVMRRRTVGVGK